MPHSIPAEDANNSAPEMEAQINEQNPIQELNGESQDSDAFDQDMTMAEAGVEGQDIPSPTPVVKQEIKLEDLFADYESDEEFPSSNVNALKVEGSPEAPPSPE